MSNARHQQCQNFHLKHSYRWHLDRHLVHTHQKESIVTIRIQSDITQIFLKFYKLFYFINYWFWILMCLVRLFLALVFFIMQLQQLQNQLFWILHLPYLNLRLSIACHRLIFFAPPSWVWRRPQGFLVLASVYMVFGWLFWIK